MLLRWLKPFGREEGGRNMQWDVLSAWPSYGISWILFVPPRPSYHSVLSQPHCVHNMLGSKPSPNISGASWELIFLLCPRLLIICVLIITFHTLMHGPAPPLQKVSWKSTNSHHFVTVVDFPVGLGTCLEAPWALLLSPWPSLSYFPIPLCFSPQDRLSSFILFFYYVEHFSIFQP